MELVEIHFQKLRECKEMRETLSEEVLSNAWRGRSAQDWIKSADPSGAKFGLDLDNFSDASHSRSDLLKVIEPHRAAVNISDSIVKTLAIEILAWGKMSSKNARSAIPTFSSWSDVCKDLLDGLDRQSAYEQFWGKHQDGKMRGIGPAYYTKLIYFLGDQSGLIMDQWTARSVNLLTGRKIIKLQKDYNNKDRSYVTKHNDVKNYQLYLNAVNRISQKLILSDPETEELIFSCGTDKRKFKNSLTEEQHLICSSWREYLIRENKKGRDVG